MIVDSAVYVDGRRSEAVSVEGSRRVCREKGGFAWVGLHEPSREELEAVTGEFGLPELAVREALKPHLRPKIEHHGGTVLAVLMAASYADESETVSFGEIHAFVGRDFIVTLRYGEASELRETRRAIEGDPKLLRKGPTAVLHAIMARVVEDYGPVVEGLENDIDEIEADVFGGDSGASRRIYELSREVIRFHRAVQPLGEALGRMTGGERGDPDARRYLRQIEERVLRTTEQAEGFRELLSNILSVNLTMVSVRQNEQVQKISAWAAILIVPTIITGIYGMNFEDMPELSWYFGYPFAILLMVGVSAILYLGFRRSGWL